MLKDFRPLPFMRVALFVDDEEVDDPDTPDDTDSDDGAADEADPGGVKANDAGSTNSHVNAGESAARRRVEQQDEGEDDMTVAETAASTLAPVRLKQEMESIGPLLRVALRRHVELREPLMATVAAFVTALNSGDLGAARRQMGRIKEMIGPTNLGSLG